jgi:hypothetical protein
MLLLQLLSLVLCVYVSLSYVYTNALRTLFHRVRWSNARAPSTRPGCGWRIVLSRLTSGVNYSARHIGLEGRGSPRVSRKGFGYLERGRTGFLVLDVDST